MIVCWRMNSHSASSSGPGLRRIASGTAILPTSCSSAARRDLVELLGVEPEPAADGQRQLADVVDVLARARARARAAPASAGRAPGGRREPRPLLFCAYMRWSAMRSAALGVGASPGSDDRP